MKRKLQLTKKHTLAVICLCFAISFSYAQESKYGIRAGVNISSISSDNIPEDLEDSRIGVVVGFLAEYAINNKISIQPELHYSAQGNKEEDLRVNYLNLPIFLKYNVTNIFNVHIGPQAGLKIWEWEDNEADVVDFGTFDFSGVVGLGANITDNFFIDVRYALGLTNVFDEDGNGIELDGNNRNIQVSVGYRL